MKHTPPRLLRAYREGLRRYLEESPDCTLEGAQRLGERALGLGMETLDLAKLHEESLIALIGDPSPDSKRDEMIRLAGAFFANAVTPIEGSHRAAREAHAELQSTIDTLNRRTLELAASNSALETEVERRELVESSLRISESTTSELLAESLHLQDELRHLSRRLLVAQEDRFFERPPYQST